MSTEENASLKSKIYPPSMIAASQGQRGDQDPAKCLSSFQSINPVFHQYQVFADERSSSSRESLRRGVTPHVSNTEDDKCNVKLEVCNASEDNTCKVLECILDNDKCEDYRNCASKRDFHYQKEDMEQDGNNERIYTGKKPKEELIGSNDSNSDTFHAKAVDSVRYKEAIRPLRDICRDNRYRCSVCPKSFSRTKDLQEHKKIHFYKKPQKCQICFKSFSQLDVHMKYHTEEKKYKCLVCPKSFSWLAHLNTHNRIHNGDFQCEICFKNFSDMNNLKNHKKIHSGEELHQCLDCPKSFTRLGNLNSHKLIHTGERPHKCSICSKTFSRLGYLKIHKKVHTVEILKPYQCLDCPKSFSRLEYLNSHKKIHTGEKRYHVRTVSKGSLSQVI